MGDCHSAQALTEAVFELADRLDGARHLSSNGLDDGEQVLGAVRALLQQELDVILCSIAFTDVPRYDRNSFRHARIFESCYADRDLNPLAGLGDLHSFELGLLRLH